ncbi:SDR family oxidoreductase [Paraconexibacter algicola]|uniref:Short chain dehydrogenase n=1 Tax=Paraconexibacter algicola TaxID=2133960 RepID=A0A2T4UMZ0_9ACTN|nr:SDR family oxidoreductase [Paraconexibacter algicola]PTL60605.1 short chain dehydrogenase [Paraconexibacter algicola]
MSYVVTGATGFIGRHLVAELLANRKGDVHVLVRSGSKKKLAALMEGWGPQAAKRVKPVVGDLAKPRLGVSKKWIAEHQGKIGHVFHLAAIYDMTADDATNELLNTGGTRHAVEFANAVGAGIFHHTSSVAAAGAHRGLFREDMFDEGQKLPSAYHRTKFESEKIARTETEIPFRVYRPAVVVGHSQTGEMDKIDGPYYFFKLIQKLRDAMPPWLPLVGPELGHTNIVPVDFVAKAMDHIAHQKGLDGQAFHLTAPKSIRSGEVLNIFARTAHAPQFAIRVDKKLTDALPKGTISMLLKLPALKGIRDGILKDVGIPPEVVEHVGFSCQFDTRDTERALKGSGIAVPPLEDYADVLWQYYERHLDPELFKDRSFEAAVRGKIVMITGASSGIGEEAARKFAAAGAIPLLVARSLDKLEALRDDLVRAGGTAHVYSADLTSLDSIEDLAQRALADHGRVDILVNNAGRSIRRSINLSHDRFHDFERTMQLNYFGAIKLVMCLLPSMQENRFGQVINVSSIGVQTSPPRFSAYIASKSALDGWTRVVSSEVIGDNVHFTTIHMPLVRTPMIAPTKMYDSFPTISPSEAADMICEAARSRPKQINTKLGTAGEVLYALAPKVSDQILHMAYKVFPDSAAARGEKDESEKASIEQVAMATVMKGVHW